MATAQHDIDHYLETAKSLAARVATVVDRIDDNRELPPDIAHDIADAGFFRLLVPRSLDGGEMGFLDFLRLVEVFAEVDSSTGWCFNQNNVWATHSTRIPEETAQEIWKHKRAVVTNGPPTSNTRAVAVDGGYKLSGNWNFSSGFDHATWIAALTPVAAPDDDSPLSPYDKSARVMLMPKDEVAFVDAWQVHGLRGTASYGFTLNDKFVPDVRSFDQSVKPREKGPMYVIPITLAFASGFATVALGTARASLDIAIDTAGGKTPMRQPGLLRNTQAAQRTVGEAEAMWRCAKAFLRESTTAVWHDACKNASLTVSERIQLRLATTHAIRTSAQIVDIAYNLCGTNAIFTTNPIHRRFQDIHVMTQHIQGRPTNYDTAGQFYLGLEPQGNF